MRRVITGLLIVALGIGAPGVAWAEDAGGSVEPTAPPATESPTPAESPAPSASAGPSQEIIDSNPWAPQDGDGNGVDDSQENAAGYAVIDANGNTTNIIVCSPAFCGSGWIPTRYDGYTPVEFARVVPQTSADRNSGNVAGYWGHYDESSSTWTVTQGSSTFVIDPSKYPGEAGSLTCVSGCQTELPGSESADATTTDDAASEQALAKAFTSDLTPVFTEEAARLPGESQDLSVAMRSAKIERTAALVAGLVMGRVDSAVSQAASLSTAYSRALLSDLHGPSRSKLAGQLATLRADSDEEWRFRQRVRALVARDIASALSSSVVSDHLTLGDSEGVDIAQAFANPSVQRLFGIGLTAGQRTAVRSALERGDVSGAATLLTVNASGDERAFASAVLHGRLDRATQLIPRLTSSSGLAASALEVAADAELFGGAATAGAVALDALTRGRQVAAGTALYSGARHQQCAAGRCVWVPQSA